MIVEEKSVITLDCKLQNLNCKTTLHLMQILKLMHDTKLVTVLVIITTKIPCDTK